MQRCSKFMPVIDRLLSKIKVDKVAECWEWQAQRSRDGYGKLQLRGKKHLAHRLSFEVHCGPIPDGINVCHRCDNPCCINPSHLFLGTQADNIADKFAKGRGVTPRLFGADHSQAKLTEADVLAIRASSASQSQMAKAFGVSKSTIGSIRTGKTWAKPAQPVGRCTTYQRLSFGPYLP
jgi:hypothetical protein